jgi:hypothetical protein
VLQLVSPLMILSCVEQFRGSPLYHEN